MASFTTHDFILAAMILCLELQPRGERESTDTSQFETPEAETLRPTDEKTVKALEISQDIWCNTIDISPEARRAAKVLSLMLRTIQRTFSARKDMNPLIVQEPSEGEWRQ